MSDKELIAALSGCLDAMLTAATIGILPGSLADRALELIEISREQAGEFDILMH